MWFIFSKIGSKDKITHLGPKFTFFFLSKVTTFRTQSIAYDQNCKKCKNKETEKIKFKIEGLFLPA
jgi:hypothetical protein